LRRADYSSRGVLPNTLLRLRNVLCEDCRATGGDDDDDDAAEDLVKILDFEGVYVSVFILSLFPSLLPATAQVSQHSM
jgi:hypothetical protein